MDAYPKWIDEYTAVMHRAWAGMVPSQWGSLNFFEVLPYLNGATIEKLYEAVMRLRKRGVPARDVIATFSCPSTIRSAFYFLSEEYRSSEPKPKEHFRVIAEYLIELLRAWTPEDIFGFETNRAHRPEEVARMLANLPWTVGTPETARELGRLYTSGASVSFALYRDMFPQESHETYGPYDASSRFGAGAILVIKDFPKMKVPDLWPGSGAFPYSRVTLYQIYKDVTYRIDWIGMHSRYEGSLINGLVAYAVEVDGRFISDLEELKRVRMQLEQVALEQSTAYESMTHRDWVVRLLEWNCYQFNKFYELAGMDWHPTPEMLERTKDCDASMGFGFDSFPTIEEYATNPAYEPYWLKDLYK